jgi:hypothetical protein
MSDLSQYAMSPALVEAGDIYIEVYPMKNVEDGSRLIERGEEPDFYDVLLRPDDWDDNNHGAYGEWEDLTLDEAEDKIAELEALNPGIAVNWVTP